MAPLVRARRKSRETAVELTVDLDGSGQLVVDTGLGFFDHFLEALAFYAGLDLTLKARGDLHVDGHHLVEDTGLTLGAALARALAAGKTRARYGQALVPMDDALVLAALDLGGRPFLAHDLPAAAGPGPFSGELAAEFLRALANSAGWCLHLRCLSGSNGHHLLEAAAKATGMALAAALAPASGRVRSTKGAVELKVEVDGA